MLHLNYDITHLRGAEYNPRHIDDEDLKRLAESIRTLGLVKPLIVRGDVLVAGHQRTKALHLLGVTHVTVYVLPFKTTVYDEIRFNQLHNGTDMDSGDEECRITGLAGLSGFVQVGADQITGNLRGRMAYVRKNIADLILKYGSWGGCVATESGEVIHCAQYALAALATRHNLTVYVVPDGKKDAYQGFLNRKYGHFDYGHLKRTTYIQTYAQQMRLRNGKRRSTLYEKLVIPSIRKAQRGIDFGAGQGDYAKMLRNLGYDLHDVELFRRHGGNNTLDLGAIHGMIDKMILDLKTHGPYDYVVCDSVLNSVDTLEAEKSVLAMVKGLCRPGGTVFISGRSPEEFQYALRATKAGSSQSRLAFIDDNGFSAQYRKGHWFYQKFHTREEVEGLCRTLGMTIRAANFPGNTWYLMARNDSAFDEAGLRKAVEYEFELPLPNGQKIGRSGDILHDMGIWREGNKNGSEKK